MSKQNPEDGDWQFSGTEKGFCVGVKGKVFPLLFPNGKISSPQREGGWGGAQKYLVRRRWCG